MSESISSIPTFSSEAVKGTTRRAARPTAREWVRHATLFAITFITATWAGTVSAFYSRNFSTESSLASPVTLFDYVMFLPKLLGQEIMTVAANSISRPELVLDGAVFAMALLSILLAHEAGHYIACRLYGVDATLPFFIPMPPPFMAGTLGAFIRIKSPIPSRRALFDIGVAGPLAGFAVLIPFAVIGLLVATPQTIPPAATSLMRFNDSLLVQLLAGVLGVQDLANMAPNPFYFAAWIGLLVTSLNLLPVGQLDGGHAVYSIFGVRAHRQLGRVAFLAVLALVPLGWIFHGAPTGLVYAVLLFIILRLPHPQPEDDSDSLGRGRIGVALLTLAVFLLSFLPFPLTVS